MVYQVKPSSLQQYRRVSKLNETYAEDLDSYRSAYVSTESNEKPTESSRTKVDLKDKSPTSVDRGLRIQGWVGGHVPGEFGAEKRSWKPKDPSACTKTTN
eukprot:scaffold5887_cov122-Cylindrotheca_fusiformis.AAC.16